MKCLILRIGMISERNFVQNSKTKNHAKSFKKQRQCAPFTVAFGSSLFILLGYGFAGKRNSFKIGIDNTALILNREVRHMIITVTMKPTIDKTVEIEELKPENPNRIEQVEHDAGGKGINVSKTIHELGGESIATGFQGGNSGKAIEAVLNSKRLCLVIGRNRNGNLRFNFKTQIFKRL